MNKDNRGQKSNPDPYQDFAQRYDLFHDRFDQPDPVYVEFFRRLFSDHHVHRVLDCACGTGRDLYIFHSLGSKAIGSDISPAMLAMARKNLKGMNVSIPLKKVDFRELPQHFERCFDAVVCLSTSLPHLQEKGEILRALSSMHAVLRDDGILVLSQGISDKLIREKPRFFPVVSRVGFSRIFALDYFKKAVRINVLDIWHSEGKKDFQVASFDYPVLLGKDYADLLEDAGYKRWDIYGDFRFSPYDEKKSDHLIVVARR